GGRLRAGARGAAALRVGLIGLGALGGEIVRIFSECHPAVRFSALVRSKRPLPAAYARVVRTMTGVEDLLADAPSVVIEVAGHEAVAKHVPSLLSAGIPVIVASIGALFDEHLMQRMMQAEGRRGRLVLPSGAIGGLDYLRALALVPAGARVIYTSRKPPAAWSAELLALHIDPDGLEKEEVLFTGSAHEAAQRFPRNLNVAMSIALACGGLHALEVHVIADPKVTVNTHEIKALSALGFVEMRFANSPSPGNPKSSLVTAYSLCEEAWRLCEAAASIQP